MLYISGLTLEQNQPQLQLQVIEILFIMSIIGYSAPL